MRKRTWTLDQLQIAVKQARSVRQILSILGLKEAGGNYAQIKLYLQEYKLDVSHLKGKGWNKGLTGFSKPRIALDKILIRNSSFQSYKLRNRLFREGLKKMCCELCCWAKKSIDGRIPLELDHINGDRRDNRLENIRILCPNCHSLQPTHRGRNSKYKARC